MSITPAGSRPPLRGSEQDQAFMRELDVHAVDYSKAYGSTTSLIDKAFTDLETQAEKEKRDFKNLKDHIWPHAKTLDSVFTVYHRQFQDSAFRHYNFIIAAAREELKKDDLSLTDRVRLIEIIKKSSTQLLEISRIFSSTLVDLRITEEILDQVVAGDQALVQDNLKIIEQELSKIRKKMAPLHEKRHKIKAKIDLVQKNIEQLQKEQPVSKQDKEDRQTKLEVNLRELERLKQEYAQVEKELEPLEDHKEDLNISKEFCEDKLREFNDNIDEQRKKIKKQLETSQTVQSVADFTSPLLGGKVAGLIEVPEGHGESAAELATTAIQGITNVFIAKKGNKLNTAKKETANLVKKVALLTLKILGAALISYLTAHIAPVAIAVGLIAVIYLIKDKPYFIKLMSYPKAGLNYLGNGISKLVKMVKEKISPSIQVSSDKITSQKDPKATVPAYLKYIALHATESVAKAEIKHELKRLWSKLSELFEIRNKLVETAKQLEADGVNPEEMTKIKGKIEKIESDIKQLQKQIRKKDDDLNKINDNIADLPSLIIPKTMEQLA